MTVAETVAEALARAGQMMTSDARDWSLSRSDVWLYGLLVGWGDEALAEVAEQHGWSPDVVARLRSYRAAIATITGRSA